jgi:hypothetical protein
VTVPDDAGADHDPASHLVRRALGAVDEPVTAFA